MNSFCSSTTIFLLAFCIMCVSGYPNFKQFIPNGYNVPNPCVLGLTWRPVGHATSFSYGGSLNPFGRDFHEAGCRWTTNLCKMDSDGDGLTNGEELGDPKCDWKKGSPTLELPNGHPGVCEPIGSNLCSGSGFVCLAIHPHLEN